MNKYELQCMIDEWTALRNKLIDEANLFDDSGQYNRNMGKAAGINLCINALQSKLYSAYRKEMVCD